MSVKFAVAINCIDGRIQQAVSDFIITNFEVDYVDMITEPGPDKVLAERMDLFAIESIKRRLDLSINRNKSQDVSIVGHFGCLANLVEEQEHKKQILEAVQFVKAWSLPVKTISGIWVHQDLQTCSWVNP